MKNIPRKVSTAIIGFGARGLSVFERLLCFAKLEKYSNCEITVYVINPGLLGTGVHTVDQKDYILLNTPVYLPTMFPGDIFGNPDLARNGLSFEEWVTEVYQKTGQAHQFETYSVQPGTYLPRRLMGEYLNWVFARLTEQLPQNIELKIIRGEAKCLSKEGKNYLITIDDGSIIDVENIFMTIGHADRNDLNETGHKIIKNPYPLEEKFSDPSHKKIALAGMGLVAFDVIAELTIGRGGRFIRSSGGELEYHPSGKEPTIYLFSKSGIPYRARPIREFEFSHVPIRLTRKAIRKIRKNPEAKLDFNKDIMPLLYDEMTISYYIACVRNIEGHVLAQIQYEQAKEAIKNENISLWLNEMEKKFGPFNPKLLIHHDLTQSLETPESYQDWIKSYLRDDIIEARKGPCSPLKCAVEAMLQAREGIREGVEFGGLTNPSSIEFFHKISPLINKNSIGPELQRSEELLALIQAGIVDLSLGPNPTILKQTQHKVYISSKYWRSLEVEVDLFCEAYLKSLELCQWSSNLVKSMINEGIIQGNSAKYPGLLGIQIDRSFRAIPCEDKKESKVWVVGVMCEGTTYYNNYVPITWQGAPSTPFLEVHTAVNSFFSSLSVESCLPNYFSYAKT